MSDIPVRRFVFRNILIFYIEFLYCIKCTVFHFRVGWIGGMIKLGLDNDNVLELVFFGAGEETSGLMAKELYTWINGILNRV